MGRSLCQSGIGSGTKLPSDPCLAAVLFWLHTHRTWVHTFIQKPCTGAGIFYSLCTDIITAVANLKRTGRAYKHSEVPDPFLLPLSFLSEGQLKGKRAWSKKHPAAQDHQAGVTLDHSIGWAKIGKNKQMSSKLIKFHCLVVCNLLTLINNSTS